MAQTRLPEPVLPEKPIGNETFHYRQDGGLSDNLIKQQLKDQHQRERDEALADTSFEEILRAE